MIRRAAILVMVGVWLASGVASAGQAAAEGEKVFAAQKCVLCHSVAGKGNKAGALDGVGSKLTADDIRGWLVNPIEMAKKHNATRKPPMKAFASLSKGEIDALVAYLLTLKK